MIHTKHFVYELTNNLNNYFNKANNEINLNLLAESYIKTFNVPNEGKNEIFETVVEWYNKWEGKLKAKFKVSLFN